MVFCADREPENPVALLKTLLNHIKIACDQFPEGEDPGDFEYEAWTETVRS